MRDKPASFRSHLGMIMFLCFVIIVGCKNPSDQGTEVNTTSRDSLRLVKIQDSIRLVTIEDSIKLARIQDSLELARPQVNVQEGTITQDLLTLEAEYAEMLAPISSLKTSQSKTYWFIVSWLKTAYKTPDWSGYYSDEWMASAKQNGIDCSGFSRVMLDQIFDKQVSGGSQRLLDHYCTPIGLASLEMGDLVFFRAPYSTNDKIVHVGVYLQENYFVHATSTKSAAKGLGLKVSSLNEEDWAKEFVSGGKLKD